MSTAMPVLAYCITEAAFEPESLPAGVAGALVESFTEGELRCFVSHPAKSKATAMQAALEFYRVLQHILDKTGVVPFRFPTVVKDQSELAQHLRDHQKQYKTSLERFRDMVQMEVRLSHKERSGKSEKPEKESSGREYLEHRRDRGQELETAATALRNSVNDLVEDWSEQASEEGLRCYVLVKRATVAEFQGRAARFAPSPGLTARLSGPWPPTQFLEQP